MQSLYRFDYNYGDCIFSGLFRSTEEELSSIDGKKLNIFGEEFVFKVRNHTTLISNDQDKIVQYVYRKIAPCGINPFDYVV